MKPCYLCPHYYSSQCQYKRSIREEDNDYTTEYEICANAEDMDNEVKRRLGIPEE